MKTMSSKTLFLVCCCVIVTQGLLVENAMDPSSHATSFQIVNQEGAHNSATGMIRHPPMKYQYPKMEIKNSHLYTSAIPKTMSIMDYKHHPEMINYKYHPEMMNYEHHPKMMNYKHQPDIKYVHKPISSVVPNYNFNPPQYYHHKQEQHHEHKMKMQHKPLSQQPQYKSEYYNNDMNGKRSVIQQNNYHNQEHQVSSVSPTIKLPIMMIHSNANKKIMYSAASEVSHVKFNGMGASYEF